MITSKSKKYKKEKKKQAQASTLNRIQNKMCKRGLKGTMRGSNKPPWIGFLKES